MEAPDNIYVPQHNIEAESIYDLCEFVVGGSVEYIRKDALLEKIDDAIARLSDGGLTGYYESLAYNDIRELIESM